MGWSKFPPEKNPPTQVFFLPTKNGRSSSCPLQDPLPVANRDQDLDRSFPLFSGRGWNVSRNSRSLRRLQVLVDVKVEIFTLVSYRLDRYVWKYDFSPIHILLNERTKIVNRNLVECKVNGVSLVSNKDMDLLKIKLLFFILKYEQRWICLIFMRVRRKAPFLFSKTSSNTEKSQSETSKAWPHKFRNHDFMIPTHKLHCTFCMFFSFCMENPEILQTYQQQSSRISLPTPMVWFSPRKWLAFTLWKIPTNSHTSWESKRAKTRPNANPQEIVGRI